LPVVITNALEEQSLHSFKNKKNRINCDNMVLLLIGLCCSFFRLKSELLVLVIAKIHGQGQSNQVNLFRGSEISLIISQLHFHNFDGLGNWIANLKTILAQITLPRLNDLRAGMGFWVHNKLRYVNNVILIPFRYSWDGQLWILDNFRWLVDRTVFENAVVAYYWRCIAVFSSKTVLNLSADAFKFMLQGILLILLWCSPTCIKHKYRHNDTLSAIQDSLCGMYSSACEAALRPPQQTSV